MSTSGADDTSRAPGEGAATARAGEKSAGTDADRGTSTPSSAPATSDKDPLRGSRASGIWVAVVLLVALLTLLAIFVLQNTEPAQVSFLGWTGEAPMAALLLIAVAAGLLIAVAAGSLRILQLRRRVRKEQKLEKKRTST